MKTKYTEIFKLKEMLEKANISFEFIDRSKAFDRDNTLDYDEWGYQILVRRSDAEEFEMPTSIIEGFGTYGSEKNLLEIWESGKEDVEGWLSADEVFKRIEEKYGDK